jgi:hypothetical protein
MDTYTTVLAIAPAPDSAAALRWAARFAARHDHQLRAVCPVPPDTPELTAVEADATGAMQTRREGAQEWVINQLDPYLDRVVIRIETPALHQRDALRYAARSTMVLVTGAAVETSELLDPALTIVQVTASGRTRQRRRTDAPQISA